MSAKAFSLLCILASALSWGADASDTKLTFDRFDKKWCIMHTSPAVVKEGMGPKLHHFGLIRFTSLMVVSDATPPTNPIVSVAFSVHHSVELWKDFEKTASILLDGTVSKHELIVSSYEKDEGKITVETAFVLFDAKTASKFLFAKECAVKIGTDEFDMSVAARKPLAAVVERFRAELAAGTFKDVGKARGK